MNYRDTGGGSMTEWCELFEDLTDAEQRRVVRVLAALRASISDELDYVPNNAEDPRSWPLTTEQWEADYAVVYQALTALMVAAHEYETGAVEEEINAWRRAEEERRALQKKW
jgi:hypothetical protein